MVPPDWLVPIRAAFADPAVGWVTGQVLPARLDSPAAFSFEVDCGGLAGGRLSRRIDACLLARPVGETPPVCQVGAGANMACRRAVFRAVGGFDPRLGAGAAHSREDSEFHNRALAAGWVCRYEPLAVVFHHHRDSLAALRREMRGHVVALFVQFGQTRRPGNLVRALVGLPCTSPRWGCAFWWRRSVCAGRSMPGRSRDFSKAPSPGCAAADDPSSIPSPR